VKGPRAVVEDYREARVGTEVRDPAAVGAAVHEQVLAGEQIVDDRLMRRAVRAKRVERTAHLGEARYARTGSSIPGIVERLHGDTRRPPRRRRRRVR
jgi:hypothetical protein